VQPPFASATPISSQAGILWRLMGIYRYYRPYFTAHAQQLIFSRFQRKFWLFSDPDFLKDSNDSPIRQRFQVLFTVQMENLTCFHFRSIWPNDLEHLSLSHVAISTGIHQVWSRSTYLLPTYKALTADTLRQLWPWPLTLWSWTFVVYRLSRDQTIWGWIIVI